MAHLRKILKQSVRVYIFKRDKCKCRYCGEKANCVDHVVPYSVVFNDDIHNLVAACTLCNAIASDKLFGSFQEKKEFIQLAREGHPTEIKHGEIYLVPVWTKYELREIRAGRLRDYIHDNSIVVNNKNDPRYILANALRVKPPSIQVKPPPIQSYKRSENFRIRAGIIYPCLSISD